MIKHLQTINITEIVDFYKTIENQIQWTDYGHKGRQAGLQYAENDDPWTSSVGKGYGDQNRFCHLNSFFKDTIFEKLITEFNLKRTRLMWVGPYACYSMHRDLTPRLHIPLITNPECYFVFKEHGLHHLSAGNVYWVDTTVYHTFMNCSDQHRLHLVGLI
jgi:hypothetical protein